MVGGVATRTTLGPRVCRFIEDNCVIPDGPDIGKPFIIPDFWRQIIYEWYELVDGKRRYSIGRRIETSWRSWCRCSRRRGFSPAPVACRL